MSEDGQEFFLLALSNHVKKAFVLGYVKPVKAEQKKLSAWRMIIENQGLCLTSDSIKDTVYILQMDWRM